MIQAALKLSRVIDAVNDRVGRWSMWLTLAMTLLSAGNAVIRKAFDYSSNALLEAQWYMFSAVFLLCAGHALLHAADAMEQARAEVLARLQGAGLHQPAGAGCSAVDQRWR